MNRVFDCVIVENGDNIEIFGNLNIDKDFFYSHIKDKDCEQIIINGEKYWVLKKGNVYIIDKFLCFNEILEKYKEEAIYDPLTGCYNKKETEEFIKKFLFNFLRYKTEPFSVLMLDIDFFKKINDTYGHLAGDFVLKQMADLIQNIIRKSDICGRFGGEEFVIVLPNTKISGAMKLANRIKDAIENKEFEFNGIKIKFTVSIGVTSVGINDSYESLMARVDEALYEAKKKGRNRIEYR